MGDKSKCHTVWLKPRHQKMLKDMPGLNIGEVTRKAIEDMFAAKNDREYVRIYIEEDIEEILTQWHKMLGTTGSFTVTSTEDGFRVVLAVLKDFSS